MNTHTILNIKTDKQLKQRAKDAADELGLPLGTVVNAFLKQFVRDKTITFSATEYQPTPYLIEAIKEAELERKRGKKKEFTSVSALRADLLKK